MCQLTSARENHAIALLKLCRIVAFTLMLRASAVAVDVITDGTQRQALAAEVGSSTNVYVT
jgi:hypothetical protein